MRSALAGDGRVYVRLSNRANARPQTNPSGFQVLKRGRRDVVLAAGPMLDTVLAATEHTDVTVLYAATVRPFDQAGFRSAMLAADQAAVVLVEPISPVPRHTWSTMLCRTFRTWSVRSACAGMSNSVLTENRPTTTSCTVSP